MVANRMRRGALACVVALLAGAVTTFVAHPLAADVVGSTVSTTVVAGTDRYDTARLAALAAFPTGATNAVLASGQNFPDGLAAADLAGALGAPLLLTPSAALDADTSPNHWVISSRVSRPAHSEPGK